MGHLGAAGWVQNLCESCPNNFHCVGSSCWELVLYSFVVRLFSAFPTLQTFPQLGCTNEFDIPLPLTLTPPERCAQQFCTRTLPQHDPKQKCPRRKSSPVPSGAQSEAPHTMLVLPLPLPTHAYAPKVRRPVPKCAARNYSPRPIITCV